MLARNIGKFSGTHLLVVIDGLLPRPVTFHTYLHASEYHLFATSKINTQLDYIAVVDRKWFRLSTWLAKSYVIEESARRALDVFDVPLSLGAPKFTVSSTDHF